MAYPSFQAATGPYADLNQDNIVSIGYPAGSIGDLLILQLFDADNDAFIAPEGWTKINELASANGTICIMWKRADSEGMAFVNVSTNNDNNELLAGMGYRFSGVKRHGLPYEDIKTEGVTQSDTYDAPSVTTTDIERLVILLVGLVTEQYSYTPTDYTQFSSQGLSSFGGAGFGLYGQQVPTAGSTTPRTAGITASCYWGLFAMALLPDTGTIGLIANAIETANPVIGNSTIGQVHSLSSSDVESGTTIIGAVTIAAFFELSSDNINSANPTIGAPEIAAFFELAANNINSANPIIQSPGYNLSANSVEANNVTIGNSVIAQIHKLLSVYFETESPTIGAPEIAAFFELAANNVDSGNPIIQDSTINLGFTDGILAGSLEIGNPAINQIHELISEIIESAWYVDQPNISKSFARWVNELLSGSNDLNTHLDGIYYLMLPDNTNTGASVLVYEFSLIDSWDVFEQNNVVDIYTLSITIIAPDTLEIDQLVLFLRSYLDNYSNDHFLDINLESTSQETEFEREQFAYNLNYKVHFKN